MKTKLLVSTTLALLATSTLSGQILLGDAEFNVGGDLGYHYDSNLQGRNGGEGGAYASLRPRIGYKRSQALISLNAGASVDIQRYFEYQSLNQEAYDANLEASMEAGSVGNYGGSLGLSYSKGSSINYDLGDRLQRESTNLHFAAQKGLGSRSSLALGGTWSHSQTGAFGNQDTLSGNLQYSLSPVFHDMGCFASYAYTKTDSSGRNALGVGLDQSNHNVNVGLSKPLGLDLTGNLSAGYSWHQTQGSEAALGRGNSSGTTLSASLDGPFLPKRYFPKTSSSLSLSYADSASRGLYDNGGKTLTGDLSVTWQAREGTEIGFSASRSNRLTIDDLNSRTTNLRLSIREKMVKGPSLAASVGYSWNDYSGPLGQSRNGLTADLSASQSLGTREKWKLNLTGSYNNFASNNTLLDLSRFTLSATLGYSY